MRHLETKNREAVIDDVIESVRRWIPEAQLRFEHSQDGVYIRILPKYDSMAHRCAEITSRGKRCKNPAEVGSLCELHDGIRKRKLAEMDSQ